MATRSCRRGYQSHGADIRYGVGPLQGAFAATGAAQRSASVLINASMNVDRMQHIRARCNELVGPQLLNIDMVGEVIASISFD